MDLDKSVFCNKTIIINVDDLIIISMGSGVGFFLLGYLIINNLCYYCNKKIIYSQEIIYANHV